jgi:hypothetical protein
MTKPKRVKKHKLVDPEPPEEQEPYDPLETTTVEELMIDGAS